MSEDTRKLTRNQLAKFLPDPRAVRAFELIFKEIVDILPGVIEQILLEGGTASATAEEALALLAAVSHSLSLLATAPNNDQTAQILRLAKGIDLLAAAPALLSDSSLVTDYIDYRVAAPPPAVRPGRIHWDSTRLTLSLDLTANVAMPIGQSTYIYVKASAAITKGQLIVHTGAVGASGVITAAPIAAGVTSGDEIIGIAAETIANNAFGFICSDGIVRGFDTTGTSVGEVWADGDELWYNPAFAGSMTKTKPVAPNQKTHVAEVINASAAGAGTVQVRIIPSSTLATDHTDVQVTSIADANLLQYDNALGYWKNISVYAASAGRGAPVTKTADFAVAATEHRLICNKAGTTTVTLPAAATYTGRELTIKTIQAQTVVSASSNVIPLIGGAAGTAILAATAGKWATLVSNGTNWEIMTSN